MNSLLYELINGLFVLVDVLILYQFGIVFLRKRIDGMYQSLVLISITTLVLVFTYNLISDENIKLLFQMAIYFIFIVMLFEDGILRKLVLIVLIVGISRVSLILAVLSVNLMPDVSKLGMSTLLYFSTLIRILSKIGSILFIYCYDRFNLQPYSNKKEHVNTIGLSILNVMITAGISLFMIRNEVDPNLLGLVMISIVMLLVSLTVTLLVDANWLLTKERLRSVSGLLEESMIKLKTLKRQNLLLDERARIHHDYKNHLIAIHSLLKHGNQDKTIAYVESVISKNEMVYSIESSSDVVNALVNTKIAENPDIKFNVFIHDQRIDIDDRILTVILGNALDNAIEANKRLSLSDRWVKVSILNVKSKILISVINPSQDEPRIFGDKFISNKGGMIFGQGIQNIKNVVESINERTLIRFEKHLFHIKVLLDPSLLK